MNSARTWDTIVYVAACIVVPIAWGAVVHAVLSRWPTKRGSAVDAAVETAPPRDDWGFEDGAGI